MHKPDTMNGKRPAFQEWCQHLRTRRTKTSKSAHQEHWKSVRVINRAYMKKEGWNDN